MQQPKNAGPGYLTGKLHHWKVGHSCRSQIGAIIPENAPHPPPFLTRSKTARSLEGYLGKDLVEASIPVRSQQFQLIAGFRGGFDREFGKRDSQNFRKAPDGMR